MTKSTRDLIIFISGLLLLLLFLAAILFLTIDGTQYIFLKIAVCLSAGLVGSQIPGMIGLEHLGIKAAGAAALALIFFFFTPENKPQDYVTLTFKVYDRNDHPVGKGSLRIIFDKSPDDFRADIKDGKAEIARVSSSYRKLTFRINPEIEGYRLVGVNNYRLNEEVFIVTVDKDNNVVELNNDINLPEKRFAVITSGNIRYTQDILQGLNTELFRLGRNNRFFPYIESISGSEKGLGTEKGKTEYLEAMEILFKKGKFDYYISIGTQASEAMSNYINENRIDEKHLFLGVTDPIDAHLVSSMVNRNEKKEISGIAYCGPVESIALNLHQMFPSKKLVYFFCRDFPQDLSIARTLEQQSLYKNGNLEIKECTAMPTVNDLTDPDAIYFSWYTLERMFENNECKPLLENRVIVSSTVVNVRDDNLSPIAVTTNDREIGKSGALMIIDNLVGGNSFSKMNIQVPRCEIYINCNTLKQKNIQLAEGVDGIITRKFGNCQQMQVAAQ